MDLYHFVYWDFNWCSWFSHLFSCLEDAPIASHAFEYGKCPRAQTHDDE